MFFVSLHSSERKFATAQYVNKERFLSPYLRSLFVIRSSARATHTFFSSSFLYLPVRLAPSFVRLLFVFCSSFLRLFFVFSSLFHYLLLWLAPSFVFLRLDSVSLYLQISFVFQTDSLYQFFFKACPPSGVRGLLTSLFIICSCGLHRLFITCPSCYDCLSCYDCSYDSHCGINSAFANYPIIYYLCPIVND